MSETKSRLLGMSFGTARARLERDLLYALAIQAGHTVCYRCKQPLDRQTFSVEHKTHWSTAADPRAAFFDLENISFSHHRCNSLVRAYPEHGKSGYDKGCRCEICKQAKNTARAPYNPARRHARYLRCGT